MPAGRPATTGESPLVRFKARGTLADRLENRRPYPDLRNEPFYGGPRPKAGEHPGTGTVAARDLATFYDLMDAELADAADILDYDQATMMLSAVWGLAVDTTWITNAPEMLASDIEDDYADDEDGPDNERRALAAMVRAWPRLRALAVLEALLAIRATRDRDDLEEAFTRVGLLKASKPARD